MTAPWRSDINLMCLSVGTPEVVRKWTINGRISKLSPLPDGSLNLKNVTEQDSGRYNCHIQNELGEDEISHTLTILAPPSPPELEIHSITANSFEIQWKVKDEKPTKIEGFTFHMRKPEGDWKEIPIESNRRAYKMNGRECGTEYEIYMNAQNKIGKGDRSKIIFVSTNGSVPTPPGKSDLIEESTDAVSLYLNTWKSNGCPIQYYIVEYAQRSSKEWNVVSKNLKPEMRRLMIPGLMTGTWYTLRMTAHNAAGSAIAEYTFATLSKLGATIAPDDTEDNEMKGLLSYLNFYIIIPVSLTAIVLITIFAVSCCYVKRSNNKHRRNIEKRLSMASNDLRRGHDASTLNYAYAQRKSDRNSGFGGANLPDDPTPYATCHLSNHPPPLPPPNAPIFQGQPMTLERSDFGNMAIFQGMHPQFFPPPPPTSFLIGHEQLAMETSTFTTPQPLNEKSEKNPPMYTNDMDKNSFS